MSKFLTGSGTQKLLDIIKNCDNSIWSATWGSKSNALSLWTDNWWSEDDSLIDIIQICHDDIEGVNSRSRQLKNTVDEQSTILNDMNNFDLLNWLNKTDQGYSDRYPYYLIPGVAESYIQFFIRGDMALARLAFNAIKTSYYNQGKTWSDRQEFICGSFIPGSYGSQTFSVVGKLTVNYGSHQTQIWDLDTYNDAVEFINSQGHESVYSYPVFTSPQIIKSESLRSHVNEVDRAIYEIKNQMNISEITSQEINDLFNE